MTAHKAVGHPNRVPSSSPREFVGRHGRTKLVRRDSPGQTGGVWSTQCGVGVGVLGPSATRIRLNVDRVALDDDVALPIEHAAGGRVCAAIDVRQLEYAVDRFDSCVVAIEYRASNGGPRAAAARWRPESGRCRRCRECSRLRAGEMTLSLRRSSPTSSRSAAVASPCCAAGAGGGSYVFIGSTVTGCGAAGRSDRPARCR